MWVWLANRARDVPGFDIERIQQVRTARKAFFEVEMFDAATRAWPNVQVFAPPTDAKGSEFIVTVAGVRIGVEAKATNALNDNELEDVVRAASVVEAIMERLHRQRLGVHVEFDIALVRERAGGAPLPFIDAVVENAERARTNRQPSTDDGVAVTPVMGMAFGNFRVSGPGAHEAVTEALDLTPSEAWNVGDTNLAPGGRSRHVLDAEERSRRYTRAARAH
jgi:hypothetical protein